MSAGMRTHIHVGKIAGAVILITDGFLKACLKSRIARPMHHAVSHWDGDVNPTHGVLFGAYFDLDVWL